MKVYITRMIPESGIDLLKNAGHEVKLFQKNRPIKTTELLREAKDADALISLLTDKIDDHVLSKLPKLKIVSNFAVGYNNIDVAAASKRNIMVTNTPGVLTETTADTAFALMIACGRRIVESDEYTRKGKFKGWDPMLLLGSDLYGKTIGIIGAGRIGAAVARRCSGFDMNILYYSRSRNEYIEKMLDGKKVSLQKLLSSSDYISIHTPLTPDTYHLIGKEEIKLMKPNAVFVNTARGEVVDEKELISALKKGTIFSAGFDVYEGEPVINKELFKLKNTVLLPHIGSATIETREKIAEIAVRNVIMALKGKKPPFLVNESLLNLN